jgi:aryl-alcohol dehydrogenase-like predicted oxidoreductase
MTPPTRIRGIDRDLFPLCLGGNVFGWTADAAQSFAVLDRYVAGGGDFVDTADVYAGSASEAILGDWMTARGNRDEGFLTGKYRADGALPDSERAEGARAYLDARGIAVLAALDEIAAAHATSVAAVALAWLRMQPTVLAPIASARTPEQLADLLPGARLELTAEQLERLASASEPVA